MTKEKVNQYAAFICTSQETKVVQVFDFVMLTTLYIAKIYLILR